MGVMTHKVCTTSKFSASGWSLVTPSTKLWKYMNSPGLYDGFSVIFRALLGNLFLTLIYYFPCFGRAAPCAGWHTQSAQLFI